MGIGIVWDTLATVLKRETDNKNNLKNCCAVILPSQIANLSHLPPKGAFITCTNSNNNTDGFVPARQHEVVNLNENTTSKQKHSLPSGIMWHFTLLNANARFTRLRWHCLITSEAHELKDSTVQNKFGLHIHRALVREAWSHKPHKCDSVRLNETAKLALFKLAPEDEENNTL